MNNGEPFPQENFRILHSHQKAGVISMMKDITNKGMYVCKCIYLIIYLLVYISY